MASRSSPVFTRSSSRRKRRQRMAKAHENLPEQSLDIEKDLQAFFVGTASVDQHYAAQQAHRDRYAAGLAVLEKNGVKISQNSRIRGLAAAWARKDKELADSMLKKRNKYGLGEVLKAVEVLDSGRRVRVLVKKIRVLKKKSGAKGRNNEMGQLKSEIDSLNEIKPKYGSATGAVCRNVRRWVRTFTKEELEFFALRFPREPWMKISQICHLNPKKDFPALPWFLTFCHGEPPPEDSVAHCCSEINIGNVDTLLKNYALPFAVIKIHIKAPKNALQPVSKAKVAEHDRFDQVLWYYEELHCDEVDKVIERRVMRGEEPTVPYGKLMERMLTMRGLNCNRPYKSLIPVADRKLYDISLCLEPPIVVMGDRSQSMDVAIRTSTIIASTLTVIANAKLVFFDHTNMEPPFIPKNIEQVMDLALSIRIGGSTRPAVSLMPFYRRKEIVKTFIIVTDEEENGPCENYSFSGLFRKYYDEIYPSKLVFVSFLKDQHTEGQMVAELKGINIDTLQFRFNTEKPDLTKLTNLFGTLASHSDYFEEQVRKVSNQILIDGLKTALEHINSRPASVPPRVNNSVRSQYIQTSTMPERKTPKKKSEICNIF